jgi:hypothetical protein
MGCLNPAETVLSIIGNHLSTAIDDFAEYILP